MSWGDDDLRAMEGAALPNPVHHAMAGEEVVPGTPKPVLAADIERLAAEVEATAWDPSQPLQWDADAMQVRARFDELLENMDQHYEQDIWDEQVVAYYVARELADARVAEAERPAMATAHVVAEARLAAVTAERDRLREEMRIIAEARPSTWEADVRDQFQEWAQSRARAALAAQEARRAR